ncbi:histone-lysine N-methyltransferase SETD1B-like [Ischnura elegans]|uniref:histone-lysine N-methyltransferase SETD1B-like n=1 Tax=Ischnura elegans TaxID=197161 RepID=UPI001ED887BB|nr:histone-lysine N-methyltransferase SETD1B-like [Ischnura elegans]
MAGEGFERRAFSEEETKILIEVYSSDVIQRRFKSTLKGHTSIWSDLGQEMTRRGFPRSGCQVKDKILNLKRRYMEVKRGLRSGDSPPDWVFWQPLNLLYGEKPSATPVEQLDSLAPLPDMDGGAGTSGSGSSSVLVTPIARRKRRCSSTSDEDLYRLIEWGQEEDRERMRRMEDREERILSQMQQLTSSIQTLIRSKISNFPQCNPLPSSPEPQPPAASALRTPAPQPSTTPSLPMPPSMPPPDLPQSSSIPIEERAPGRAIMIQLPDGRLVALESFKNMWTKPS